MRRQPRIDWGAFWLTAVPMGVFMIGVAAMAVLIVAGLFGAPTP